ncbi:MAG TPA: helix-turn-helix transcriptional regulator [Kofleriaceae bacterium]|nr:helix-turn-helix transcriptional regulator [Kofleriaceae bacterium]
MKESKRKKLQAAGWAVGSAAEFLELTPIESVLVELRIALSQALKERRVRMHISQATLAARIESSQSRVAKMEAADPQVSFELLLRGLIAMGATRRDVAIVFDPPNEARSPGVTSRRQSSDRPEHGARAETPAIEGTPRGEGLAITHNLGRVKRWPPIARGTAATAGLELGSRARRGR